jgi:dephospho-CoA kinase
MRVVGLTGGIASGKSTVGRLLAEKGVPVIDADQVARDVVAPGEPALAALVDAFGEHILAPDGTLDRPRMRAAMTADPTVRERLSAITHPAIRAAIAQRLATLAADGTDVAVVEAALLVETGSHRMYPQLIVVSCAPETQLARLVARDGTTEEAARDLIATQLPLADKEAVATVVIRNDGDLDALRAATADAWDALST